MRPSMSASRPSSGGSYFSAPSKTLEFIPTGCLLLDCVVGGGWPLGRVSNIIGDKSTGKTLLAIEAAANFAHFFPTGSIIYNESESAFQKDYAEALGLPRKRIEFRQSETVEDLFLDLTETLRDLGKRSPGLYILDSLDALTDKSEKERKIDEGSYGAQKAKKMSELFRRLVRSLGKKRVHVMIISQVRDNIGVSFGRKVTRSGGRALDFYASQVIYLAHIESLKRKIGGVQRAVGVRIKAKCDKNKIALPFRECEFTIRFGYGVDDIPASIEWLEEIGKLNIVGLNKSSAASFVRRIDDVSDKEFRYMRDRLIDAVPKQWARIEKTFLPKRSKYSEERR